MQPDYPTSPSTGPEAGEAKRGERVKGRIPRVLVFLLEFNFPTGVTAIILCNFDTPEP